MEKGLEDSAVHLLAMESEDMRGDVDTLPTFLADIEGSSSPRSQPNDYQLSGTAEAAKKPGCGSHILCWAALLSALGGVLFGYDIGIISGALLQLREDFCLSCGEREAVVSAMLAGAILASLTGGWLVDLIGRRVTIMGNAVLFTAGAGVLSAATSFPVLIVGRLVLGFAVALSVIAECVYISEISPAKTRGFLVSLNEMGIVVGFLVAYLIDFSFIQVNQGWRFMFGLSAIPAVIQGVGMCFLPSSPRYLLIKGQDEQAKAVLHRLYGASKVDMEFENIKSALAQEKSDSCAALCSSKHSMGYRLFIGMGLVFLQQFTGQPNVLYYAPTVFQAVGFRGNVAATLATVLLGVTKVVACGAALLLLDRVGRRKCLMSGALVMTLSITMLGLVTLYIPHTGAPQGGCTWGSTSPCLRSNDSQSEQETPTRSGGEDSDRNARSLGGADTLLWFESRAADVKYNTGSDKSISYDTVSTVYEEVLYSVHAGGENDVIFRGYVRSLVKGNHRRRKRASNNATSANTTEFESIQESYNTHSSGAIVQEWSTADTPASSVPSTAEVHSSTSTMHVTTGHNNDAPVTAGSVPGIQEVTTRDNSASDVSAPGDADDGVPAVVKWTALVALVGFVGGYELGFGAGTWLILAEIYPSAVRGRAIALATVFNWGTNLLVSLTFLDAMNTFGVSWTFLPYGVICAVSAVFVYLFVPETKGKTLEQISQDFYHRSWGLSCCCRPATTDYTRVQEHTLQGAAQMQPSDDDEEF